MSTLTVSDVPLETDGPAQRLRRMAAAVRVSFTWWGVRKALTLQQKEEVGMAYDADARFITAGKKIVDVRHEAFRKLTALRTRITNYWHGVSLPYVEPGIRLVRQADIEALVHTLDGFRTELVQAETELNAVYADLKTNARRQLGRLYNPSDYPPELRGMFAVEYDFPAVEPPAFLQRLNPDLYQQEQERVARRFEEAVQLAEQGFIAEFAKVVSHITERLSGTEDGARKIFRDSAVTNLREFFGRFSQLNVRSSAQLDELVAQAQHIVEGVKPQDLRDNESLRQHVTTQLSRVQAELDGMLIDQPRRRIIRAQPSTNGDRHDSDH